MGWQARAVCSLTYVGVDFEYATEPEMARNGTVQMSPRPPVPEIVDIIEMAGSQMHDMLLGAKTIDQALSCSQNRTDELMRVNGHYQGRLLIRK